MKIGELFVQLGVQADTFTVKDFVRALGEIPFTVGAAVTSLAGASFGFVELTKTALDMSNGLAMFRSQTGLSTDELQRWQVVAKEVGVSGDAVTASILGINNALAQIRLGHGESLLAFGRLGVNRRGNAMEILQQIAEGQKRLPPNEAMALMGQLGISPEMMRLFNDPSLSAKLSSARPMINRSSEDAMVEFQKTLADFNITVIQNLVPVLKEITPYMGDLAQVLGKFIVLLGGTAGGVMQSIRDIEGLHKAGVGYAYATNPANIIAPALAAWLINQERAAIRDLNVTQNIHSNADPEEVARHAHEGFKREKVKAAKMLDNQGY